MPLVEVTLQRTQTHVMRVEVLNSDPHVAATLAAKYMRDNHRLGGFRPIEVAGREVVGACFICGGFIIEGDDYGTDAAEQAMCRPCYGKYQKLAEVEACDDVA